MSEEPTPGLNEPKDASLRDRGYRAGDYPPLLPLPRNLKRGRPTLRVPRFPAKLGTLEIQRMILPKSGRGPGKALVWGWPTPIPMNARTELPPLPRKPVYGSAARDEVRRILREAKREGINFGWFTKMNLYRVIKGGAASELLRVGGDAGLCKARPQGAEARAGCAGTTPASPCHPRPGPHGWLAAGITELSPKARRQELVRSRRAARGGLAQPVAFRASRPRPERPRGGATVRVPERSEARGLSCRRPWR